ncbi:hypothetical protein [Pinisolibacter sp.]|uniref:hypothetical protein n=1 Tax=Pinisolibacter sp. TaxID=2172024 RepID=UPI002FDD0883
MSPVGETGRRAERIDLTVGAALDLDGDRRRAVEDHFATMHAANPALWNGPFFLFEDAGFDGDTFRATARPTDYATFLEWRGRGFPGDTHAHIFPVPALTTADRRLLVGVMGRTTANAGLAYPPSGSFDHLDVVGDRLDPVANMVRELAEEVGIDAAEFAPDPGFTVIASGPRRLALVKRWRTPRVAADLATAIAEHLGREHDPELGGFDFVGFDRRLEADRTVGYVNTLLGLLETSA